MYLSFIRNKHRFGKFKLSSYTLTQNENITHLYWDSLCMKTTPVPPNAGTGIQSFVGMLNFSSWGMNSPIFSIGKGGN